MEKKKFTYQQRAEAFRKLAGSNPLRKDEDNRIRQAYAQSLNVPILREVKKQSSVMSIYTPIQVQPREQAEFQVEPSVLPSTNRFTGAPTDPLLVYEHPGRGPVNGQLLSSKTIIVPTGFFEHESGFPVHTAERALFNFEEAHRQRLANAVITDIENRGWALIQTVVAHTSFPAAQTVEIAAGQPGAKAFSRQLFGKIMRLALDIGIITQGEYTPTLWISNQSFEEYTNWDIATQFDPSMPAQVSEELKTQLNAISGVANVSTYRGIPIVALRDLATGDVAANKDYCYLTLKSNIPNGLVIPVRLSRDYNAVTGLEEYFPMQMLNDPSSVYDSNEIRTKLRWQCGFACLDARTLYTGVIDRS